MKRPIHTSAKRFCSRVILIIIVTVYFHVSASAIPQKSSYEAGLKKAEICDTISNKNKISVLSKSHIGKAVRVSTQTKSFYLIADEAFKIILRTAEAQKYLHSYFNQKQAKEYSITKSGLDLSSKVTITFKVSKEKSQRYGKTDFGIFSKKGIKLFLYELKDGSNICLVNSNTKMKVIITLYMDSHNDTTSFSLGRVLQTLAHEIGLHVIPVLNFLNINMYTDFNAANLKEKTIEAWNSNEVDVTIAGLTQDSNMDEGNPTTSYINISEQVKEFISDEEFIQFKKSEEEDQPFKNKIADK